MSTAAASRVFEYAAYTGAQDGYWMTHVGTLAGARRKAVKHAREAFPAWTYKGYGPTVLIRDAETRNIVAEFRL